MNHYVYDYETLKNCFVGVFEHYKQDEVREFVIHNHRNDLEELILFLLECKQKNHWHIGFNSISFDSQITEHILRNQRYLLSVDADTAARWIYNKAQVVIHKSNLGEFSEFPEWHLQIKQIDVFKMNHWDNPAKRSSLKWIQYSMDWFNLQDMPIHHETEIQSLQEIDIVKGYCRNDVRSTKKIMELSIEQIRLRKALTDEYGLNLYSASEARISKELFLHFLSNKTGMEKRELKMYRTQRDYIDLGKIILPYIHFKSTECNSVLEKFKGTVINAGNTKGGMSYSIKYKGVKTDFGLGGVHGAAKPGIYKADDNTIIITSDVISFYPNLAIRNKWAPAHIPKREFCDLYEWFFDERKKIPKKDPKNYVYKIVLNATYGLSNDKNCFLYDPEFTMRITINGQLSLLMLYEMIMEGIPGAQPIMQNTDGLETIIPKEYREKYMQICAEWETMTKLQLEHGEYSKLILADVNNYIAVSTNGEVKCKGRFEWEDLEKKKVAVLHKNKSHLIIPKALYHFFVHDTPPEKYLAENRNILDYCAGIKAKGQWEFRSTCVVAEVPEKYKNFTKQEKVEYLKANGWEQSWADDNWVRSNAENKEANTGVDTDYAFSLAVHKEGRYTEGTLQKTVRYYISKTGCKILKHNKEDGRKMQIESGHWMQTVYNVLEEKEWSEFNVNEDYYLDKIYKEIGNILPAPKAQLQLF